LVDIDNRCKFFRSWKCHGFKYSPVNKYTQPEQGLFQLPWKKVVFSCKFALKDTPDPLVLF